jgi:hypothetical protein
LLIEPRIVSSSAAITARTSFAAAPVVPARWCIRADLLSTLLTGRAAALAVVFRADFLADFLALAIGVR